MTIIAIIAAVGGAYLLFSGLGLVGWSLWEMGRQALESEPVVDAAREAEEADREWAECVRIAEANKARLAARGGN